ncbi:uncharacterized protein CMU_034550 [Cryptosporidium muris RN66]|uniref:Transmembrane protein n=1 Tax=Cryptosporidium muris (strain RN66) TaxID=441375 RepID=B6AFS8_CRYMR|nr:uncharacterized protein CMU_034550 [Cryptosporidium muris RN66]EEA07069.1 hypothetical protein, conserved [Cryptosporidium muris RN66]|eukprot:XP_002141418.1 hypothetical protein [Cryptosporidium muris RN66]
MIKDEQTTVPLNPLSNDSEDKDIVKNSYKRPWIADNRIPPRRVQKTNISKLRSRLFAYNQRSCSISLATAVGSFRFIHVWAKLLAFIFSSALMMWSSYCTLLYSNIRDIIFYISVSSLLLSILCCIIVFLSCIFLTIYNGHQYSEYMWNNTGIYYKIKSITSLKVLSILYLFAAIFSIFPILFNSLNQSLYKVTILSIILVAHIIPSTLFYFAYIRGEDCKLEPISILI